MSAALALIFAFAMGSDEDPHESFGAVAVDTAPAAHVAPTGSVHGHVTYLPMGNSRESLFGLGGELGVRLYGSAWRPSGPFIGAYGTGGRGEVANLFVSPGVRPRGLVQLGKAF